MRIWRVAIMCFDHMHARAQLRVALEHPAASVVGVYDSQPDRMRRVCAELGIPAEVQYVDADALLDEQTPDIVMVCSTTAAHVGWVEALTKRGVHVMLEKPFATSLADADRMIDMAASSHMTLTVNWPLAWYPPHRTTYRLLRDGVIGDVVEVHYYDGNQGPVRRSDAKTVADNGGDQESKNATWWYQKAAGGGATRDYLGYGATIATWFRGGELPSSVVAALYVPDGLQVDEQGVVIASYQTGLSTFQTRWGTFTSPRMYQPQPRCGFVVVGSEGTIASWDYAESLHVQTRDRPAGFDLPVDVLAPEESNALGYLIDRLDSGRPIDGPTSWQLSRAGQRIVDTALASAERGVRTNLAGYDRGMQ